MSYVAEVATECVELKRVYDAESGKVAHIMAGGSNDVMCDVWNIGLECETPSGLIALTNIARKLVSETSAVVVISWLKAKVAYINKRNQLKYIC